MDTSNILSASNGEKRTHSRSGKLSEAALAAVKDRTTAPVPLDLSQPADRVSLAAIGGRGSDGGGHGYLKAKFQIGSCKGPLSFKLGEQVFHPDDIPESKQVSKKDVKAWKRRARDHRLGTQVQWDKSVEHPDPINCMRRRVRVNGEFDRPLWIYNYRSEVLPPKALDHVNLPHKFHIDTMTEEAKATIRAKQAEDPVLAGQLKRTQEYPNHPDLAGKTPWRTKEFTQSEVRAIIKSKEDARKANSATVKKKMSGYISPMQRYNMQLKEIRGMKEKGVNVAYQAAQDDASLVPTYNRLAKEPSKKTRSFQHSGVFEFNKGEGRWMWSDTGSFERQSPGDVVKVHNPNAFNFASPTSVL